MPLELSSRFHTISRCTSFIHTPGHSRIHYTGTSRIPRSCIHSGYKSAGLGKHCRTPVSRAEVGYVAHSPPIPGGFLVLGVGPHGNDPRRTSGSDNEDLTRIR